MDWKEELQKIKKHKKAYLQKSAKHLAREAASELNIVDINDAFDWFEVFLAEESDVYINLLEIEDLYLQLINHALWKSWHRAYKRIKFSFKTKI